jgi:hypothetical protein
MHRRRRPQLKKVCSALERETGALTGTWTSTLSGSFSYTAGLFDEDCGFIATLTFSGTLSGAVEGANLTFTTNATAT